MLAALLISTALLAALAWTWPLRGRLLLPERLAAAAVAAVVGAAWVSFLLVLGLGFTAGLIAAPAALAALAGLGAWWGRRGAGGGTGEGTGRRDARLPRALLGTWLVATGLATTVLAYLYSTHFLPDRDGGMGSGGSTWGDLALHASLTSRFAQEPRFEWGFPLLVGAPLTYPFLPDFLSGMLVRGGLSLRWGLLLPTLLLAVALVQLLFFAGWRGGRSARAAVAVLLLVLLDGSAAGIVVFVREWWGSGTPLLSYLEKSPHDFAHVPTINVRFSNIICDALLPSAGCWRDVHLSRRGAAAATGVGVAAGAAGGGRRLDQREVDRGGIAPRRPAAGAHPYLPRARWADPVAGDGGGHGGMEGRRRARASPSHPVRARHVALARRAGPRRPARGAAALVAAFADGGRDVLALAARLDGRGGENPFTFWLKNLGVLLPLLVLAPASSNAGRRAASGRSSSPPASLSSPSPTSTSSSPTPTTT